MRRVYRIAAVILICLAIGLILYYRYKTAQTPAWFDWRAFVTSLRNINKPVLALAFVTIYATYLVRSLRWQQYVRPIAETRLVNLLVATVIGFTSLFLLGRAGEVVRPLLIARKENLRMASMMGVWLLERIQDLLSILLWMGLGLTLGRVTAASDSSGTVMLARTRQAGWLALAAVVAATGLLALWRFRSASMSGWLDRKLRFLPHRWHRKISDTLQSFGEGLQSVEHTGKLVLTVGYSIFLWLLISGTYYIVCQSFGGNLARITFAGILLLVAIAMLGSTVQIPGVGGGVQAATFIALTAIFGISVELAASATILIWLLTFAAVSLVGIPLMIREGLSLGQLRAMARARAELSEPPAGTSSRERP
ncbi:MAG TPA: lysylphosphatidylglycerol synthase transmembrane domain-containing protein [Candidatus Acidoferrales bacterium]